MRGKRRTCGDHADHGDLPGNTRDPNENSTKTTSASKSTTCVQCEDRAKARK